MSRLKCTKLHLGLDARKPVFGGLLTTKAQSDQHVFYSLIIFRLATSEFSIF